MRSGHKGIEAKLIENLGKIKLTLDLLGFDRELSARADECIELIKTNRYNVAVMGEFKRGKSTLINALLGSPVLPADIEPTTATVNRITYGDEPRAVAKFKDGGEKEVGIGKLANYVSMKTSDSKKRAASIREVVVEYPTPICRDHIDIIDTPGLNDDEMTGITVGLIDNVDAVIVPLSARKPFSETERDFVCRLISSKGINDIIFVVTRLDELDEDEYVYEDYMQYVSKRIRTETIKELEERRSGEAVLAKAHSLLDKLEICGISARDALKAYTGNDPQKLKKSRFEEFVKVLNRSVASSVTLKNAIEKTVGNIERIISEFEPQNSKRLKHFAGPELSKEAVEKYCEGVGKFLDRDSYDMRIPGADEYKPFIVQIFIRELSAVTDDTDACIRAALMKAQADVAAEIGQKLDDGMEGPIRDCFGAAAGQIMNYRRSMLDGVFGGQEISGELSESSLVSFVEAIRRNAEFSWSVSPIPAAGDLAEENDIIKTVARAAEASLENYRNELLEGAVPAIMANWSKQIAKDKELVRAAVGKAANAFNSKRAAYEENYKTLREKLYTALDECESMRE
jgi:hypothetical protein